MDKIFIKDLLVRGIIGVNDWEREIEQDILINAEIYTDTHHTGEADDLQGAVNYRTLSKMIQAYTESAARRTVEALANDLANLCLEDAVVTKVLIRVEKPGAVRFAKSVGVEIERSRKG
jgi:FolB domain-containing protein